MEEKKKLRKIIQQKLGELSKPQYEHLSYQIAQNLFSSSTWKESNTIGITISKMPEVDTYQIIRKGWEQNKRIVIPKCYPIDKSMKFRKLTAFNQLESVYYGLFEPIENETSEVPKEDIELLIIPGLAFTRNGYRLGFGGGYYDRYLMGFTGKKLSLAFNSQLVQTLPTESHDIPTHQIITEEETIKIYG
jgi:5-formyltetrahydrofolate cyclo-ligase